MAKLEIETKCSDALSITLLGLSYRSLPAMKMGTHLEVNASGVNDFIRAFWKTDLERRWRWPVGALGGEEQVMATEFKLC